MTQRSEESEEKSMDEMMTVGSTEQASVSTDTMQVAVQNGETALSDMLAAEGAEVSTETPQEAESEAQEQQVSGGIKGRLLEAEKKGEKKGYDAGRQAAEQEYQTRISEYEKRLEKLAEIELKEEAKALAASEGCSEALAMRILRAERGLGTSPTEQVENVQPKAQERQRDESGRFTKAPETPNTDARAQELFAQAQQIERLTGVDALKMFNDADAQTRDKIATGKMDFFDLVAESKEDKPAAKVPPMLKGNGGGSGARTIGSLSDSDFDKMDDYVRKGGVINLRK